VSLTTEQIPVDDAVAVIAARGELDRLTSDQLKVDLRLAIDRGFRYLCIDLLEISYMDSSGFGPMIEAYHRLGTVGGAIAVACREIVCEIFEVTGLASVFALHHRRQDALEYLDALGAPPS